MPRVSSRVDKVADLLKKEIALSIQNEIRDPRVGMASVTGVKVSKDLAHANVFVTMMGKSSEQEAADGIAALNKASGYLRTLLAKTISLRTIPKLKFIFDDSLARGEYLTGLIDEALARDLRDHHLEDDEDSH
jgi:ribosome-binding factor A